MEIRKEIDGFYELEGMCWSGATDTLDHIIEANKEDEFMELIEGIFYGELPTEGEINDFIWFETDFIYENIGLTKNGNLPEDEMSEEMLESIDSLEAEEDFEEFCCDCDTCICNAICKTVDDCKALFEDYKNQITTLDEIKNTWEERTGKQIIDM